MIYVCRERESGSKMQLKILVVIENSEKKTKVVPKKPKPNWQYKIRHSRNERNETNK